MDNIKRFPAVIAYLPVIGWLYVLFFERKNPLAMFHARQSIGLALFLLAIFAGWAVIGWVLAWIPYAFIFSMALFALVIGAFVYGLVIWIIGIINAIQGRAAILPIFGRMANNLPL